MRILLDATCWYAATFSEGGGSRRILKEAEEKEFAIVLSETIFQEAWKNIFEDSPEKTEVLLDLVLNSPIDFLDSLTVDDLDQWRKITVLKDLHVLAAAFVGNADVLITFDREHLLTQDVKEGFPIPVMETKEFWQIWYPSHSQRSKTE